MHCPKGDYRSIETRVRTVADAEELEGALTDINHAGDNFCSTTIVPVWGPNGEVVATRIAIVYQTATAEE